MCRLQKGMVVRMSDMQKTEKKKVAFFVDKMGNVRLWMSIVLAFAVSCAFPWMLKLQGNQLAYTNSIVSVFVFGVFFVLIKKALGNRYEGKWTRWFWPGALGFLFSLCMVAGAQLDSKESVPFTSITMWLAILVLAVAFALLIRYFWDVVMGRGKNENAKIVDGTLQSKKSTSRSFWLTAGVIFLCYLPVFLAVYPGFFVYDAQTEVTQVITREFSTHHPLVHVLLLGGLVQLGYKIAGSYNVGIAIYTLLQMFIMSGIFAFCIQKLKKRGLGKMGQILLTLYFGLCPVLVMFSLCSTKDGLFTGLLLVLVLLLQDFCANPQMFFKKKSSVVLLVLSAMGMMLLRHNGFYALLVFTPFFIIFMKKYWKRTMVCMLVAIVLYSAINFALATVLQADDSENQEILTVPIMQMARVYVYEHENLPSEEIEKLSEYIPEKYLMWYNPKLSDGVKWHFNNENYEKDSAGFWKLWAKWGLRYPFTYVNAWLMTSYGFWYPDTVIDVYKGNVAYTFVYEDSSYFGYEVEEPGFRESKIPWLDELYRKMSLEIFQQKVPVVSMLFSPGFMLWVFAFLLGFLCYKKRYDRVLPFFLPVLCWLTVILGPTYLTRYVVFLWVLLPVLGLEVYKIAKQTGGQNVEEMKQL